MNRTTTLSTMLLALALVGCGDDTDSAGDASSTTQSSTEESGDDSTTAEASATGGSTTTPDSSDTGTPGDSSTGGGSASSSSGTGVEPEEPIVVPLPGASLFPEGMTAMADGTLFIGSVGEARILRIDPPYEESDVSVFADGQLTRAATGVFVDEARGVLLVCDSNPGDPVGSGLSVLDLQDGMRIVEHVLDPAVVDGPVLCNDGLIAEDGAAYVTDSFGERILRIADVGVEDAAVEVFVTDPLLGAPEGAFGANGLTVLDGEMYAVNFNAGTLVNIERDDAGVATGVVDVPLVDDDGRAVNLVGPDGIEPGDDGSLFIVENGIFASGAGNRVVNVTFAAGQGTVREVGGPFDVPTAAALTEDALWVLQSQFDHLFGIDQSPPEPFTLIGLPR